MPQRPQRLPRERSFAPTARAALPVSLMTTAAVPAVSAARRDGARQGKSPEKEIAIVAQEVVNANHPQQQRRVRVPPPHARTPAFGAALGDHPATSPSSRRPTRRTAAPSPPASSSPPSTTDSEVRARALSISISRWMRVAASSRAAPPLFGGGRGERGGGGGGPG